MVWYTSFVLTYKSGFVVELDFQIQIAVCAAVVAGRALSAKQGFAGLR